MRVQARRLRKTAAREVQDATQALEHTRASVTGVADRRTGLEVHSGHALTSHPASICEPTSSRLVLRCCLPVVLSLKDARATASGVAHCRICLEVRLELALACGLACTRLSTLETGLL